jgi:hypothetical protein
MQVEEKAKMSDTANDPMGATPVPEATDPVSDRLTELGVEPDVITKIKEDLGAKSVDDLAGLTETDLVDAGMKRLPARKLLKALAPVAIPTAAAIASMRAPTTASTVRLQEPPTSASSWLSSLCAIRPQIIQPLTVLTGIKAAMADVYGYFQLPRKMMRMLREASDSIGEGVPDLYFELQSLTQARRYGALVAWMQGKGSACTVAERNRFLQRMHEKFWDATDSFCNELEAWRKGRRDSLDIGEQMAAAMTGEMQIYDATQVRTAALALGDSINRVFSGTGVYAATALALDNERLQEVLAQLDFRQFGVQSREKLLADLECAVPAEMVSAENTIAKFAWNAMSLRDTAAGGMDEQRFLIELAAIGTGRQWNTVKALAAKRKPVSFVEGDTFDDDEDGPDLSVRRVTGIGGRRNAGL